MKRHGITHPTMGHCWVAALLPWLLIGLATAVFSVGWQAFFLPGFELPIFNGSDSFAHAARIRRLATEPWPPSLVESQFDYPKGVIFEWPAGFDCVLAVFFRVAAAMGWGFTSVAAALPFTQIVVAVIAVSAVFRLVSRQRGPWLGFACGVCMVFNGAFQTVSAVGGLDHHGVETVAIVLLLFLPRVLEPHFGLIRPTALGVALAVSCWCSTLVAFGVAGALGMLFVLGGSAEHLGRKHLRAMALGLCLPLLCMVIWESSSRGQWRSIAVLSPLHWVLIFAAAILLELRRAGLGKWAWLSLALFCGSLIAVAGGQLAWALDFLMGSQDFWKNLGEMRPILFDAQGPTFGVAHILFGWGYWLCPAIFLLARRLAIRERRSTFDAYLYLGLFLLSFCQQRFAHLFVAPFVIETLKVAAFFPKTKGGRGLAVFIAVAVLLEPVLITRDIRVAAAGPSVSTGEAIAVCRELVKIPRHDAGAVFAPPNMGNAIVWLTGRPVVSNTFFYPERFQFDAELRDQTTVDGLVTLLRQRNIELFVAADDVRFRVMLYELLGRREEARNWRRIQYSPCSDEHFTFAYDRLACGSEQSPALEQLWRIEFAKDSYRLIRQLRLYRIKLS